MIYVLVHKGKHESVDSVMLKKFETIDDAESYISEHHSPEGKYYTCCSIIEPDTEYEISGSGYGKEAMLY